MFLDLSRAFDTISHKILLEKLSKYGIRGNALNWFKHYLSDRKQFVKYNQSESTLLDLDMGVPQGSILGPLLFLIYVNDLHLVATKLTCIQFADDTCFLYSGKSISTISSIVNSEMNLVTEWFKNNMLTLNPEKSNYMIMSNQGRSIKFDDCNIVVDKTTITPVREFKFLGVILDDNLTWTSHIKYVCSKVSKLIGILVRARKILHRKPLCSLYQTLIKPYFSYSILLWGNSFKTHLQKLIILQKKIVRIITNSEFRAHTANLFVEIKIMPLEKLYIYFAGIYLYKCRNKLTPKLFWNVVLPSVSVRNPFNLVFKAHSKRKSQMSIRYYGPKIWNELPKTVKLSRTLSTFKFQLKKFLLK